MAVMLKNGRFTSTLLPQSKPKPQQSVYQPKAYNVQTGKVVAPKPLFGTSTNKLPTGGSLGASPALGVGAPAPSGGTGYQPNQLLESIPEQPTFDETPFNDLIGQIDQLGSVFRSDYDTATKGIQNRSASQLTDLENQKIEAEQGLTQYRTAAEQDTEQNVDEQRRQFSEVQQGIQARYGGATGTGAFASELVGRETMRNIGSFRQNLQNEYSKVQNMQNSLNRTYISETTKIKSQTEQLLAEARNQLNKELANLQIQKGGINMEKANRRTAALENYQSIVRDINARNTNYLQNLQAQREQIQNQLQASAYKMQYQATQKMLGYYESLAQSGNLSDEGLRSAEQAFGFGIGTLQQPKNKKDPNSPEALAERAQALANAFDEEEE